MVCQDFDTPFTRSIFWPNPPSRNCPNPAAASSVYSRVSPQANDMNSTRCMQTKHKTERTEIRPFGGMFVVKIVIPHSLLKLLWITSTKWIAHNQKEKNGSPSFGSTSVTGRMHDSKDDSDCSTIAAVTIATATASTAAASPPIHLFYLNELPLPKILAEMKNKPAVFHLFPKS